MLKTYVHCPACFWRGGAGRKKDSAPTFYLFPQAFALFSQVRDTAVEAEAEQQLLRTLQVASPCHCSGARRAS